MTLQLSVKERDTASQRTTLEAWIAGQPRLVATSSRTDLDAALIEVRDDLIRQITDAKHRSEPRNNRFRRKTLCRVGALPNGREGPVEAAGRGPLPPGGASGQWDLWLDCPVRASDRSRNRHPPANSE